jgi:hypothetical protein
MPPCPLLWLPGLPGEPEERDALFHTVNREATVKRKTNRSKTVTVEPTGSWSVDRKTRAAVAWRIHTPKSRWFGPVTVTKVEVAA